MDLHAHADRHHFAAHLCSPHAVRYGPGWLPGEWRQAEAVRST